MRVWQKGTIDETIDEVSPTVMERKAEVPTRTSGFINRARQCRRFVL